MNDDLSKKLGRIIRTSESQVEIKAQQEFAEVRQWYHSLPIESRQKFKQDVEAIVEMTERLQLNWGLFVRKAHWSHDQYDNEGNVVFSIGAEQSPKSWLEAINLWDETENLSLMPLA